MKRRDFLRTAGATAAIGSVPLPALSSASAAPVTSYGMSPYVWAKYTARINKKLTPQMLTRFCGFSDSDAVQMIRRLTFEKVLVAPDATGISRTSGDYLTAVRDRREALKRMVQALRERPDEAAETGAETPGSDAPESKS